MLDEKYRKIMRDIKKISNPEILKRNLVLASLILTSFEILKNSLVKRPHLFFGLLEYDIDIENREWKIVKSKNEKIVSTEFLDSLNQIKKNLAKNERRDDLKVMSLWFKKWGILTDDDIEDIIRIRLYRNEVAHEMLKFLIDPDFEVDVKYLLKIKEIVDKVDVWWTKEFTIPTDPEFDNLNINKEDIKSGNMLILDLLLSIALDLVIKEWKDIDSIMH